MTVLLVSGFGRCGSSLTMQMLAAGGYPVTGRYPYFEAVLTQVNEWEDGTVAKILDPQRHDVELPPDRATIWLDRNRTEQAKSWIKFHKFLRNRVVTKPNAERWLAKKLRAQRRPALRKLTVGGRPVLKLSFEKILADPREAAVRMAAFAQRYAGMGPPSDAALDAMAAVVLDRGAECQPDMLIERINTRRGEQQ